MQLCQGWGRGFESLRPLQIFHVKLVFYVRLNSASKAFEDIFFTAFTTAWGAGSLFLKHFENAEAQNRKKW